VLRLGTSEGPYDDRRALDETNAALDELETLGDQRALAAALCTRAESECNLGQAADGLAAPRRAPGSVRAGVDAPRAGCAAQLGRRRRLGARDPGRHADRLTGAGTGGRGHP